MRVTLFAIMALLICGFLPIPRLSSRRWTSPLAPISDAYKPTKSTTTALSVLQSSLMERVRSRRTYVVTVDALQEALGGMLWD